MRLLALLALFASACTQRGGDGDGLNQCDSQRDCPRGAQCEDSYGGLCVSPSTATPYTLVLQVSEFGSAAGGLTRFTFPPRLLEASEPELDLSVPQGVSVLGTLLARDGEQLAPVSAEVSFAPEPSQTGFVVAPVVVRTRGELGDDGNNLRGTVAPDRTYDVIIHPLGADSHRLPPVRTRYESRASQPFAYTYENLETFSGVLVDELGVPQAERWLRIHAGLPTPGVPRAHAPDAVVSSLAMTAADGSFTLSVLPGILTEHDYVLEVSLFDDVPWTTTIEVDAARVRSRADGKVVLPVVPAPVRVLGSVEAAELAAAADANLSFVSSFPLPTFTGEVNDRDWCRSHVLGDTAPAYRCQSRISASTDRNGSFDTRLLPGDYRVFISPSRATENSRRTLTTIREAVIETQPGGVAQGGQLYDLDDALFVRGTVSGFSGRLENAIVRMLPLSGPPGTISSPFNRTSEGISNGRGDFELYVDRGYFDLVVRPPEDSGYSWLCAANRVIEESFPIGSFTMPAPLVLGGVVTSQGVSIPGAVVDAYALVRDLSQPGQKRGVRIGSTTSDAEGRFQLELPTSVADEN